jgi:hypothetical protein
MRHVIVALGLTVLVAGAGCGRPPSLGPPPKAGESGGVPSQFHNIAATSVFGSVDVRETTDLCAGRVRLAQGAATVNDACFTGDTNVVLCTDTSSANAVKCAAANGKLALAGNGSDLINYARVR